jgi:protein arginine N-methyltransferase 3
MLESVLLARDRFLKPGGAILPDVAEMYVAAAGGGALGLNFWDQVYGFSMGPVREAAREAGEIGLGGAAGVGLACKHMLQRGNCICAPSPPHLDKCTYKPCS